MATFTIKDLSFTYPLRAHPALKNIDLTVEHGTFVTLCGKSGCGKSTLLRNLKTELAPHGHKTGNILFYGRPLDAVEKREQSTRIGYVLQNPDNQIVTDKVWHELAFGLESLGYDTKTIRLRVAEMASFFGIQTWFMKNVNELSGGQKQILNLASVMVMQPDVLILDEPTAQLDPIAASEFLETVQKINREIGTTVIITEHRLEEVLPMSDRVIVMDQGKLIIDDIPENAGAILAARNHAMFLAMPAPLQAYAAMYRAGIRRDLPCPIDVRDGRGWLTELFSGQELKANAVPVPKEPDRAGQTPAVRIRDVWFKYNKDDDDVVKDLSLDVYAGELFCMVGGNGSGKTTTLNLISGINKAYRGKISVKGKVVMLPQNPQAIFAEKTVGLDLMEILEGKKLSKAEKAAKVLEIAKLVEIEDLLDVHPYDLSGGEQQRAALGKVLLLEPEILLLDEPTKGLDAHFKAKLSAILKKLLDRQVAIIVVSHDIEYCGRYGDRCAMFFDGNIATTNTPNKFFSGNNFYTTAANRMSRHIFENAVVVEDVITLCRENLGGEDPDDDPDEGETILQEKAQEAPEIKQEQADKKESKLSRKSKISISIVLLLMPITLLGGIYFLDDRKYYFTGLLLIVYVMVPFFMIFEQRKPQAREIIVIAVMIAIAVAGRAAFFMVPSFKPVVALVIITGVCLGPEAGFLVGAMTGFVSNFMFGQGPWTPWQMFSFGIIGFAAGMLIQKRLLKTSRRSLLVFGAVATFFIYGGIVDLWTIFGMSADVNWGTAITVYTLALPFNIIHTAATVIFLYFLANPMVEKLSRMKVKYGLFAYTSDNACS